MKNFCKILVAVLFVCAAFYFPAQAQTNVSGGIYANTTWTLANSPYIVTDTVVVFPGVTLTIQPGVVVKCSQNVLIEIRQASLIANGTASLPITFNGNSGSWQGISLITPDTIVFNHCTISNSKTALDGAWTKKSNLLFTGLNFSNNNLGFEFYTSFYSKITIDSSSFSNNSYGIGNNYFDMGNISVLNSNFTNNNVSINCIHDTIIIANTKFNGGIGINQFTRGNVLNCSFLNHTIGISFYDYVDMVNISNCTFRNCYEAINDTNAYASVYFPINVYQSTISKNYKGIVGENFRINSCVVDSNTYCGIMGNQGFITNNSIRNNGIGIVTFQYNNPQSGFNLISKNIITNNSVGLQINFWLDSIFCNKIFNNSSYNFRYNNSANAHLGTNDWNDTSVNNIRSKIFDGFVNINYGLVNFLPIDTSKCYLTGCNLFVSANVTNSTCGSCANGSAAAMVSNGVAPYAYTWYSSPFQTVQTATGLLPGTYTLCVTDHNGCSACNKNIKVDSTLCAGFNVTATVVNATCANCSNGSATANIIGGIAPYNYNWNSIPPQTTPTAFNLNSGTYKICVTDAKGCVSCDTSVFVDSLNCIGFGLSIQNYNATCASCNDGSAKVVANGGTSPYNYTWYTSPLQTTDSAVGLSQGTYHVCVTDHYGCVLCDSATINIGNCSAHFNMMPTNTPHNYLVVNMASGAAPLTYLWQWGDGTTDTARYPSHTYASAGFYTICLSIADANSCTNNYCDSFYLLRSKNAMVTVNVVAKTPTGISTVSTNDERLTVYPNPASSNLELGNLKLDIGYLEVTDLSGRVLKIITNVKHPITNIQIEDLSSGIYFLKAIDDKGLQQVVKFVKE